VQFYGDDGTLLHELKGYFGTALGSGSSAIIIATPAHIDRLTQELRNRGINISRVQAEGRYITLDASNFLSRFMVGGTPDPARFTETMGEVIQRASKASLNQTRRVVAFGEMVALLWAEGKSEAALQLETLWNELAGIYSFSLHCAYPVQLFSGQELEPLLRICAEHTDVVQHDFPGDLALADGRSLKVSDLPHAAPSPDPQWYQRQEPFRLFIDNVQDYAIFMLNPEGRISTWNAGAERIKGYRSSEIIGRHFSSFYLEEDVRAGKPERLLGVAEKYGRVEDEGWRVRKDGSQFWAGVTIAAVRNAAGQILGFGKVTRDLTERRRAELALRRSELRSHAFVDAVQDYAIFMLDPSGCVSTWNVGAERIKGYKPSEIIGQHFSRFYPEQDIRAGKPDMELHIAARDGRFEDEGWRIRKDGSKFWANVIITPIKDDREGLIGFSKVTRDSTDRMLAQRSLEESRQKLQESEQSLRDLSLHLLQTQDEERRHIGREMHDSLGQYLSVLKLKLDSMSAANKSEEITECTNLLEECIKEVRTISYLLYPPMLEEMGLNSAIPWYLEGFSSRSGIKTTFQASEDFGRLSRAAELVLFRVLQESLTNVQRHSGSATAEILLSRTENAVTLRVTDQGKGLPAQIIEQGNQDWKGAVGVGLRGMTERLRQLGGSLDISSNQSGTQVRASLPIHELSSVAIASTSLNQISLGLYKAERASDDCANSNC
jgi:PAS domain S-box-containing protein